MERLVGKYIVFGKALRTFETVIMLWETRSMHNYPPEIEQVIADSLVQRFEFTYEMMWKYFREYLRTVFGISVVKSSRIIFKEAHSVGLLNGEELELCENMIMDRNNTSHEYDLHKSRALIQSALGYCSLMQKIHREKTPPERDTP